MTWVRVIDRVADIRRSDHSAKWKAEVPQQRSAVRAGAKSLSGPSGTTSSSPLCQLSQADLSAAALVPDWSSCRMQEHQPPTDGYLQSAHDKKQHTLYVYLHASP